jgi:anti-anti-sigma factor
VDRGVAVVGVAGEMDYANAGELTAVMSDVLDSGHPDVVIDVGDLSFVDSGGLGAMVAAWKATRAAGGSLQLARAREHLLQMLRITGLIKVFVVRPTLAACFPSSPAGRPGHPGTSSPASVDPLLRVQHAG